MAPNQRTVISPTIARINDLPYFEIVVRGWGSGEDNGIGRFFQLPDLPLAGLAIAPESTVNEVYVLQDFRKFVGSLESYDPTAYAAAMELISSTDDPVPPETTGFGSGQTVGGQMKAHAAQVSSNYPLLATVPSGTAIVARNRSRHNRGYWDENGARQEWAAELEVEPVLVLRCYLKKPGPMGVHGRRVPYLGNVRSPTVVDRGQGAEPYGIGATKNIAAIPIAGRKSFHLEMWAIPSAFSQDDDATITVRASVIRGGEAKLTGMVDPSEAAQFFEDTIIQSTVLTPGAPTELQNNKVRYTEKCNTGDWLLLFAEQSDLVEDAVDIAWILRAED